MQVCAKYEKFFCSSRYNCFNMLVISKIFFDCDTQDLLQILLILMQNCLTDNDTVDYHGQNASRYIYN